MRPTPIIFDFIQPINKRARSRKTDPGTSHDAAKRVELGKAERQRKLIYDTLQRRGQMTCEELGRIVYDFMGDGLIGKVDIGKRIGEIEGIAPTGEVRNGSRVWGLA